ncbi:hypothetical protein QQS21_003515 [Conoideocrella luteorostrata]|uniref:Uncharacterized protein n=1 Tax=Conoideocrella luteorostrata TaxID=1105319 RepID=A0AAJ0CTA4_9HYPO|nr:hypothetical protein QQS21_003515 [Conoideocrella luteorostrata]
MPSSHSARASEAEGTGIIAIGMALGSPTSGQDPFSASWQPRVVTTVTAAKEDGTPEQQPKDGLSRSISRKWAIFSRSKSRRVKDMDKSHVIQDQLSSTNTTAASKVSDTTSFHATDRVSSRGVVYSPSKKPLERAFTEPTASGAQRSLQTGSPYGNSRTTSTASTPRQGSAVSIVQEPLLDVNIPDINMERFSVMFAGVLERRRASLLARRQHTQDKLRGLNDGRPSNLSHVETHASRRKHSNDRDLPPIPPLRIEPLHAAPLQPLNSRLRSNTSPAALTPSKEQFGDVDRHISDDPKPPHIIRLASVREKSSTVPSETYSNDSGRPQLRSKFHIHSPTQDLSASKSSFSYTDDQDRNDEPGGLSPPPAKRYSPKYSFETESLPESQLQAAKSTSLKNSPDTQASMSLSLSSLSGDETDEDGAKAAQDAVQVSIARQISVSREQRRMLGPLQMNPMEGRRLAETKSSTPRLVVPGRDASSPFAGHRKSERVVLEGV